MGERLGLAGSGRSVSSKDHLVRFSTIESRPSQDEESLLLGRSHEPSDHSSSSFEFGKPRRAFNFLAGSPAHGPGELRGFALPSSGWDSVDDTVTDHDAVLGPSGPIAPGGVLIPSHLLPPVSQTPPMHMPQLQQPALPVEFKSWLLDQIDITKQAQDAAASFTYLSSQPPSPSNNHDTRPPGDAFVESRPARRTFSSPHIAGMAFGRSDKHAKEKKNAAGSGSRSSLMDIGRSASTIIPGSDSSSSLDPPATPARQRRISWAGRSPSTASVSNRPSTPGSPSSSTSSSDSSHSSSSSSIISRFTPFKVRFCFFDNSIAC